MKHILLIIISLLCFTQNLYAVKAIQGVVTVTQPDGSKLKVQIYGDEFFSYYTTADGYTISKGKDGFFYYADYSTGQLMISSARVGGLTKGAFMSKGVPQSVINFRRSVAKAELEALMRSISTKSNASHPLRVLVILAQYSDLKFVTPNPKMAFTDMLNQQGYSANGATGSAADYYSDNSMGKYRPEFVVTDVVTLPKSYRFYGEKTSSSNVTSNAQQQTMDACNEASKKGVNFGDFDANNDGMVDIVFIYYAGHNAAEGAQEAVWPHQWAVSGNFRLNGKQIFGYACTSELTGAYGTKMTGIGTLCHEFAHTLGLYDFYDTSNGGAAALWGSLALMDSGNYNNEGRTPPLLTALERSILGWLTPTEITKNGAYVLENLDKNRAYVIQTGNSGEYFLLENRQSTGWDRYINNSNGTQIPRGMLIVHVDKSNNPVNGKTASQLWSDNEINNTKSHQCVDLVEACGHENRYRTPISDVFFPGTKNATSFTGVSTPNNLPWSGKPLGTNITNISLSSDQIHFDVRIGGSDVTQTSLTGTVYDFRRQPLPDARVSLYLTSENRTTANGKFMLIPMKRAATKSTLAYETTTNGSGQYELRNINHGTYIIEVKAAGHKDYLSSITLKADRLTQDACLIPTQDNPEVGLLKHHNDIPAIVIGKTDGSPFYARVNFSSYPPSEYNKNKIRKVTLATGGAVTIEMTMRLGGDIIARKTTTVSGSNKSAVFDLSQEELILDNSLILSTEFKLSNYTGEDGVIVLDSSPVADSYTNLISDDGSSWRSLKESEGIDGNFIVTVELADYQKNNGIVSNIKSISTSSKAFVSWDSDLPSDSKWMVRWSETTEAGSEYLQQIIDKKEIVLNDLPINTAYNIKIGAIVKEGTEPLEWANVQLSTSGMSIYSAIAFQPKAYKVADVWLIDVSRTQTQVETVSFTINGEPFTNSIFRFTSAGLYKIVAVIKYTTGDIEIIKRTINVTAQ